MRDHIKFINCVYKLKKEITINEKNEINEMILSCFDNSRFKFYEEIVYYKYNGKIIGFAGLYFIDKYLSINQLCVNKDYRRLGIGSTILDFIIEIHKNKSLILYIDKNKKDTNCLFNFYSNRGFKLIEYLKTFNLIYEKDYEYLMIRET